MGSITQPVSQIRGFAHWFCVFVRLIESNLYTLSFSLQSTLDKLVDELVASCPTISSTYCILGSSH